MVIPRDVQEFLDNYPDISDDPNASANIEFYSNRRLCRPDNHSIEEIHARWPGDYAELEYNHGYIQWLFPIREHGMNFESQPLQPHEIVAMKADDLVMERIIISYQMMLNFYGMRLLSAESGLIDRVLPPGDYVRRYKNLIRAPHNNLRISRILKCLSELGLEHLSIGFLLHVLSEQSESNELNSPFIRNSMDRWWANCLRNTHVREWIGNRIRKVRSSTAAEEYIFTRAMYEDALDKRSWTNGQLEGTA